MARDRRTAGFSMSPYMKVVILCFKKNLLSKKVKFLTDVQQYTVTFLEIEGYLTFFGKIFSDNQEIRGRGSKKIQYFEKSRQHRTAKTYT